MDLEKAYLINKMKNQHKFKSLNQNQPQREGQENLAWKGVLLRFKIKKYKRNKRGGQDSIVWAGVQLMVN